jgi:hypothetical protein
MDSDPTPVFRWCGTYVGFFADGWFFSPTGRYLGWYEANLSVWAADGTPLGTIVDRHYVLRDLRRALPARRTPRVPPLPATPPQAPGARLPRVPRPGWGDALAHVDRQPLLDELLGEWRESDHVLLLLEDGRFLWRRANEPDVTGTWELRRDLMVTPDTLRGSNAVFFAIIEYTGNTLTLRRTQVEQSLPFTLHRRRAGVSPSS